MKSNISFVPYTTINHLNSSRNNRLYKIHHVLINLYEKNSTKQNSGKILNAPEHKTNSETAAETFTTSNSKTKKKIEISEHVNKKKHKPKIKQKKYCKLIEEFAKTFNDIEKKNLNKSFLINVDLMKKNQKRFCSINKNNLNRNNDRIKNPTSASRKTWVNNYSTESALRKYKNLSASIKNKFLNNKTREIPKQLEINKINFVNIYNKNKFFPSFCQELNLYTSENSKNDIQNFECEEIAQRRPGRNKDKINISNEVKIKKSVKQNITQINFNKKKYEVFNYCSNLKSSNNIKKCNGRKKNLNDVSPMFSNRRTVNLCLQELKNKNNNELKKTNDKNVVAKNKSFKRKKLFIKNTEYNPKVSGGKAIFDNIIKKKQITLENNPKDCKRKKKDFISLMSYRFAENGKNAKNEKF